MSELMERRAKELLAAGKVSRETQNAVAQQFWLRMTRLGWDDMTPREQLRALASHLEAEHRVVAALRGDNLFRLLEAA